MVTDYSRFLKLIRVVPKKAPKGQIDKLDLANPITTKASEAQDTGTTQEPQESVVNYDMVKSRSQFDISTEYLEDNIEGGEIQSTLTTMFRDRFSLDHADLAVNGDEGLSANDAVSNLRKINDGMHVQTILCPNILDAGGLGVSLKLFKDALNKFPVRYKARLRPSLRFMLASNPYEDFSYFFGNRQTQGGDSVFKQDPQLTPLGIKLEEVPEFPVDLSIGTAAADGSFMVLTDPRNFIWFIQRKIEIFFEKKYRRDVIEATMFARTDFAIENLDACVKVRSLSSDAGGAYA